MPSRRQRRLTLSCAALAASILTLSCNRAITSSNDVGPALPIVVLPPVVVLRPSGPDPQVLEIHEGRKVTFINGDTRPRQIFGDVHPTHTGGACPEMNLGALQPGESREVVWSHTRYIICYYHDEAAPDIAAQQGVLVVY
jgi:hypothetical protein